MNDEIEEGFEFSKEAPKIIKVIGVGGGGGNAVTHMFKEGIHNVTFLLCNTDKQALKQSEVPNKYVLGESITRGLGAGNRPKQAQAAAEESEEDIKNLLNDGTNMVFITAGMGGGTGTGAAPIIARIAKEMGILTVGIVTIPFLFEGERKIIQALNGVDEISQNVDALLVINNERLREIYPDFSVKNAFAKADDTLAIAAKSIAEIITRPGLINVDFADVETTMKDGGVALISNGYGDGDHRAREAIDDALKSPLLNTNDIFTARKILLNISFSEDSELLMAEMDSVHDFMSEFNSEIEVIWGTMIDNSLGHKVKMTILATGFGVDNIPEMAEIHAKNEDRINKIYNTSQSTKKTTFAILSPSELDDDNFITLLEDNPTYNRNEKLIKEYRDAKRTTSGPSISLSTSGDIKDKVAITF
jgi:cell division protein FtsZ